MRKPGDCDVELSEVRRIVVTVDPRPSVPIRMTWILCRRVDAVGARGHRDHPKTGPGIDAARAAARRVTREEGVRYYSERSCLLRNGRRKGDGPDGGAAQERHCPHGEENASAAPFR